MLDNGSVLRSTRMACLYLSRLQSSDGYWRDFQTRSSGRSTEWTTGYVCRVLAGTSSREAVEAGVAALLASQRADGGWGYNQDVVPDADSTAACLLSVAGTLTPDSSAVRNAVGFILAHQDAASGGISTYQRQSVLQEYRSRPRETDYSGWCQPHVCVTGSCVSALLGAGLPADDPRVAAAVGYLIAEQDPEGFWDAYWWVGPFYATGVAVHALKTSGIPGADVQLAKAGKWLLDAQSEDGCWDPIGGHGRAFDTALALQTLLTLEVDADTSCVVRAVEWLLGCQLDDGSWSSHPMLRIPPPHIRDVRAFDDWRVGGRGTGSISADDDRVFTTATVLRSLLSYTSLRT